MVRSSMKAQDLIRGSIISTPKDQGPRVAAKPNGEQGQPWGIPLMGLMGLAMVPDTVQNLGPCQALRKVLATGGGVPSWTSATSASEGHRWSNALLKSVSATWTVLAAKKSAVALTTEEFFLPHHWPTAGAGQQDSIARCQARTKTEPTLMGRLSYSDFLGTPTTLQLQSWRAKSWGKSSFELQSSMVSCHKVNLKVFFLPQKGQAIIMIMLKAHHPDGWDKAQMLSRLATGRVACHKACR